MVAAACERVMNLQTIITLLNSTVDTSNVDQALLIDFRKKVHNQQHQLYLDHVDAGAVRMETQYFLILF